jgi:hypothetical protein
MDIVFESISTIQVFDNVENVQGVGMIISV